MDANLVTALIGFGGSAIGALSAIGATWLTLTRTERAERDRRSEERRTEYEEQLRRAYVAWFHAAHRLKNVAIELQHKVWDLSKEPPDLIKALQADPVFLGADLDLLEVDTVARERLKFAIKRFGLEIDAVLTTPRPKGRQTAIDGISLTFRDFRHWLVNVRFAPGYVVTNTPQVKPGADNTKE